MCHGHRATIVGPDRPGHHLITGTRHRDVIVGTDRHDEIHARGGNDLVCGRGGTDRIYGGPGDDRLHGGLDRTGYRSDTTSSWAVGDTIDGGPGDDLIDLGYDPGQVDPRLNSPVVRDTVSFHRSAHGVHVDLRAGRATGDGHDRIVGRPGFVWVQGSTHDDRILGSDGSEEVRLGDGDDLFRGRGGDDRVSEGSHHSGTDRLFGGPGDDYFWSSSGGDLLSGGAGGDTLTGWHHPGLSHAPAVALPADIRGGAGEDDVRLTWIRSGDRVSGGDGTDLLQVAFGDPRESGPAAADLGTGTLSWGHQQTAAADSFEKWFLDTSGPLTLHGSEGPDLVGFSATSLVADLGAGDDLLTWRPDWYPSNSDTAGDDTVDGGPGTDTVDVGEGNDTCTNVEAGPC
jgi:Ca2+-binding RTX toxin-like protein